MQGKRRVHPNAEKHSEVLKRLGYLAPRLWDREEAGKEHSLATEQWADMLRLHIPGLCISDMPRMFELPATMPDGKNGFTWSSLNDREFDQSRWNEIPAHLKEAIEGWGSATTEILEGWTYESVLPPNAAPRTHDEPNPRVYMLNGKMVRSGWKGDDLRKRVCALFEIRLLDLFRLSPNNVRKQNVADRLQHHWEHGGNADAFLDYIEGVCEKWAGEAPTYFDMPRMQRLQVEDAAILMRTMRKWVEEKRKAATPKGKAIASQPTALTVPIVARLCWCMEKAGHTDHGIVNATAASRLAKHYGQLHDRAGEKLKQERDRFDGADGKPYLKGGARSREAYGRKTWAAVKAELDRLGQVDAAAHAEAILSDL